MGEKLKPRVGDRVIVYKSENPNLKQSVTGTVTGGAGHTKRVDYDTGHHQWLDDSLIHVLDREPVEWPEGWGAAKFDNAWRVWPPWADDAEPYGYLTRELFDRIRGPEGDYMHEHWDELIGEG